MKRSSHSYDTWLMLFVLFTTAINLHVSKPANNQWSDYAYTIGLIYVDDIALNPIYACVILPATTLWTAFFWFQS